MIPNKSTVIELWGFFGVPKKWSVYSTLNNKSNPLDLLVGANTSCFACDGTVMSKVPRWIKGFRDSLRLYRKMNCVGRTGYWLSGDGASLSMRYSSGVRVPYTPQILVQVSVYKFATYCRRVLHWARGRCDSFIDYHVAASCNLTGRSLRPKCLKKEMQARWALRLK